MTVPLSTPSNDPSSATSARLHITDSAAVEASFDVVVIGAGHAGTEAAVAAARSGASVALITGALEQIGHRWHRQRHRGA